MMKLALIPVATLALLAGCATPPPSGPSVMVLPGSGKSFDQFRFDEEGRMASVRGFYNLPR